MDNALEPYDGEEPGREPGHPCQKEDGERDETLPSGRVGQQRLHIDIRVRLAGAYSSSDARHTNLPHASITDVRRCPSSVGFRLTWTRLVRGGGNRERSKIGIFHGAQRYAKRIGSVRLGHV